MSFEKRSWSEAALYWHAFVLGVKDPVHAEPYEYICRCRNANNMPAVYGIEEHICETYDLLRQTHSDAQPLVQFGI